MANAKKRDGVFQRKDRRGWWVSYINSEGTRCKQKVTASTRTQAIMALSAIKTGVEREKVLGVKRPSEITTEELLVRYKQHQKSRVKTTTFDRIEGIIRTLKRHLPEKAKAISRKTIADYISHRSDVGASRIGERGTRKRSAATIQKEVAVLKHALRLAIEWEMLHTNPAEGAKLPKIPQGRTRYLTPAELKVVLDAAPGWMRRPIALAAFTGMRRGELLSLRNGDVDIENRRLYLRETKNGNLRVLALNDLAIHVLIDCSIGEPSNFVFPGLDGQKLSVYSRRLFHRLGIIGASFHSLRHTAASWLVMQGVDLYAVGQLLGHRTPRMTQRYAHLSPSYMAAAVSKLDVVFGEVMPNNSDRKAMLVPAGSPGLEVALATTEKLLN